MPNRSHYLPRVSVLESMSDIDRWRVLDLHRDQLIDEVEGLKSGYITPWRGAKHYQLKLSRARLRRVEKLGKEYGLWLDEVAA